MSVAFGKFRCSGCNNANRVDVVCHDHKQTICSSCAFKSHKRCDNAEQITQDDLDTFICKSIDQLRRNIETQRGLLKVLEQINKRGCVSSDVLNDALARIEQQKSSCLEGVELKHLEARNE